MGVTLLVVIVAVLLGAIVIAAVRRDDPWQSAARELDLKLTRTLPDLLPNLEGMLNGLPIRIEGAEKRGPGIDYTVFYPPLGIALKLQRETTITRTLGQLGETDTQMGARVFDDSFRVNTSRPDALRDMMTTQLRRTLVQLIERYPKIVIADGAMTLATEAVEPTAEEIISTITHMAGAAHQLVSRRPQPLEKRPPRPAPKSTTTPPTQSSPVETPAGIEQPQKQQPQQQASRPAPETAATSSTAPVPDPPEAPTPSTGLPDGFFEEVFGANRLSFESSDSFDAQIRGTRVTLAGTVKQARDQAADDDSGRAITKATITVAQIDNDLYGKTDIDAIVQLPAGAAAGLERGQGITFEGAIDGVDAFMRNLFIADGKVVG